MKRGYLKKHADGGRQATGACHITKRINMGTDFSQAASMAIVVLNKWAHQAMRPGDNTTGLGCWSWVRLRG